ncbi:MAG: hypothetical protein AAGN15_25760 [Cyanobacteria bacterium J06581_3]
MHNRSFRSKLLAFSLGVGCCFSAMPVRAQALEDFANKLSFERSEVLLQIVSGQNASESCDATEPLDASRVEFVQSLLQRAETVIEQEEDPNYKAEAFYQIGKSYACLGAYDQADAALKQSISLVPDDSWAYYELARRVAIAEVYGTLMGDVTQMDAVIAEAIATIDLDPNSGEGTHYDALNESASLYATHKQYQPLRTLLDLRNFRDR